MKQFKKLAGQTVVYGMGTIIPRFLNYVIMAPYFTRLFKDDNMVEYGKVTELYAYIAFFMVLLTYGMETSYFKFVQENKNKRKVFSTIMTSIFVTSLTFLAVILVSTNKISVGLEYAGEPIFIRLLGAILAIEAITAIPFAKLRIEEKPRKFAVLKLVQVSVNIGLMLMIYNVIPVISGSEEYLLNADGKISSRFIFLANLLANGVVALFLLNEFRDYSVRLFDIKLLKHVLVYGLPLLVSGLAGVINETLDRSVYRHIIQDDKTALLDLAVYGANYKIAAFIMLIIQMFRYAAEPFFFNYSKENDSKKQFAKLMNIFVGFIIGMGIFILLFIDYFKIIIDKDYHVGLFVVPYIILSYILYGILFNLSVWFKLSGKTRYAILITLVGAVVTLVINFIYVPQYGYLACAWAHVVSYSIMVILSYSLGQIYYKIPYNVFIILVYIALGVGIYKLNLMLKIDNTFVLNLIRLTMVSLFITFVGWKENIFQMLISRKRNGS